MGLPKTRTRQKGKVHAIKLAAIRSSGMDMSRTSGHTDYTLVADDTLAARSLNVLRVIETSGTLQCLQSSELSHHTCCSTVVSLSPRQRTAAPAGCMERASGSWGDKIDDKSKCSQMPLASAWRLWPLRNQLRKVFGVPSIHPHPEQSCT